MLAVSDKNNRTLSGCDCGESTSSFGMSVHFCDDHTSDVDCFSEGIGLCKALLADRTVHDENDVVRVDNFLDLLHFVEKFGFLFMSSWSIDYDDFHVLVFELIDSFFSDGDWVGFNVTSVERHSYFGSILFQLVEGTGSEGVSTDHGDSPSLLFVEVGHFRAGGCFSTSLQSYEHDDVGFSPFWLERFFIDFQEVCQLFDDLAFDEDTEIASFALVVPEFIHDVLSHFHYIANVNVTC